MKTDLITATLIMGIMYALFALSSTTHDCNCTTDSECDIHWEKHHVSNG